MPTFYDPVADAEEAYEALRALAHQTKTIDEPGQIYRMLGNLSAATCALGQTLHQLAAFHDTRGVARPVVDGNTRDGRGAGHEVSWELHRAGEIMTHVADCIDRAHEAEGTIAYLRPPAPSDSPNRRRSIGSGLGL